MTQHVMYAKNNLQRRTLVAGSSDSDFISGPRGMPVKIYKGSRYQTSPVFGSWDSVRYSKVPFIQMFSKDRSRKAVFAGFHNKVCTNWKAFNSLVIEDPSKTC